MAYDEVRQHRIHAARETTRPAQARAQKSERLRALRWLWGLRRRHGFTLAGSPRRVVSTHGRIA